MSNEGRLGKKTSYFAQKMLKKRVNSKANDRIICFASFLLFSLVQTGKHAHAHTHRHQISKLMIKNAKSE